jgi:hypothetical protein
MSPPELVKQFEQVLSENSGVSFVFRQLYPQERPLTGAFDPECFGPLVYRLATSSRFSLVSHMDGA